MNSQLITWILGLITLYFGARWQNSVKENERLKERLSKKKEKLYADFINLYFGLTKTSGTKQEKIIDELREFNEKIILVGSNKVILTYGDLMQNLYKNNANDFKSSLRLLGELMVSMREDLGHNDFWNRIYWFDTLRPWMRDIDAVLPPKYRGLRRVYSKIVKPN